MFSSAVILSYSCVSSSTYVEKLFLADNSSFFIEHSSSCISKHNWRFKRNCFFLFVISISSLAHGLRLPCLHNEHNCIKSARLVRVAHNLFHMAAHVWICSSAHSFVFFSAHVLACLLKHTFFWLEQQGFGCVVEGGDAGWLAR